MGRLIFLLLALIACGPDPDFTAATDGGTGNPNVVPAIICTLTNEHLDCHRVSR